MDLKKFIAFNSDKKNDADPEVLEGYARSLETVNESLGKMLLMGAEIEKIREDLRHVVKDGEFKGAIAALLSQIEPLREEIARQVNTEVEAIRESFGTLTSKTSSLQRVVDSEVEKQNLRIINHFETQEQKLLDLRQAVEDRSDLGPVKQQLEYVREDLDYLKSLDLRDNVGATQEAVLALSEHTDKLDEHILKLAQEILEFKQDVLDSSTVHERKTNAQYQEVLEAFDAASKNFETLAQGIELLEQTADKLSLDLKEQSYVSELQSRELEVTINDVQNQLVPLSSNLDKLNQEIVRINEYKQLLEQNQNAQKLDTEKNIANLEQRIENQINETIRAFDLDVQKLTGILNEQSTRIKDLHRDYSNQINKVITEHSVLLESEKKKVDGDVLFEDRYNRIIKRVQEVEGYLKTIDEKTKLNEIIHEHVKTGSDRLDSHAEKLLQQIQDKADKTLVEVANRAKLIREASDDQFGFNAGAGIGVNSKELESSLTNFKNLKDHYTRFVERVQRQLSEMVGGGGSQFLWDLVDVDINTVRTPGNGELLIYSGAYNKWIAGNAFTISSVQGNLTVEESLEVVGNANIQGILTVGGNIILGNNPADFLVFQADVNSNFVPDQSNTFNLGSNAQTWGNAYIDNVYIDNMWADGNIIPVASNVYDLGNATHRWRDLYLSGNSLYIGTVTVHDTGTSVEVKYNNNVAFRADTTGNITSNIIGDVTGRVSNVANHTTDAIREGTINLYHTPARVRTNISAGIGVLYNNTTGQIRISQNVDPEVAVTFSNVTVTGNLNVLGAAANFEANILNVQDPSIIFGDGNPSDVYDLGIHGEYVNDGTRYSGLFRDASAGTDHWKLYANLTNMPQNFVDTANISFDLANLELSHVIGRVTQIDNFTTTDLVEGGNLYYTDVRVWANVGANIGNINSWTSFNSSNIGNLNSWVRITNANIGNLNSWVATNQSNLGNVNAWLVTTNSNLGNVNAWTSSNSANIGNINSWLRTTNANVGNINGWLTTTNSNVGNINSWLTATNANIGTINSNLGNLNAWVVSDDANIGNLNAWLVTTSANVGNINGWLTTTNSNVGNLNSWTSSNSANVGNLNSWIRTLTTTGIAEGANLYFTTDRVWANVGANVGNLNGWISTTNSNLGNINSWTSANSANIGNLNSWVRSVYNSIPTSANNINSITGLTAPALTNSAGTAGEVRFDSNYFYVCIATNTWRRANLHTW